jgi:hypothetical protein
MIRGSMVPREIRLEEKRVFVFRDGNGSDRAITRPPAKRLRVKICTRTSTHG